MDILRLFGINSCGLHYTPVYKYQKLGKRNLNSWNKKTLYTIYISYTNLYMVFRLNTCSFKGRSAFGENSSDSIKRFIITKTFYINIILNLLSDFCM